MSKLNRLAEKYQTDKGSSHHNYCNIYEDHFKGLQNSPLVFLEIGVGGYEFPDRGGGSLKTWEEYFPYGKIHGIDIYDKSFFNKGRIQTHMGSQIDEFFLNNLIDKIGSPDVILDDGSHISEYCIKSFEILFPRLKNGGIYVMEDCHTSYWKEYFFGGTEPNDKTTMNYFKGLADSLYSEFFNYQGPKFDIKSITFYKKLIFIYKN